MIHVDLNKGSIELLPYIRRIAKGITVQDVGLSSGDFYFQGNGPDGRIDIGIERKTVDDMLDCIETGRYMNSQRLKMKEDYNISVLFLEGHWRPHDPDGWLMEGYKDGLSWGYNKHRSQRSLYSGLYRYLISVASTGVIICYPRNIWQCAYDVVEWYHYWQKPFHEHNSARDIYMPAIPSLTAKPSLVKKWAYCLDDVGPKISDLAARHFRKPITLAEADETEWVKIPGVGVKMAKDIVRKIRGW